MVATLELKPMPQVKAWQCPEEGFEEGLMKLG